MPNEDSILKKACYKKLFKLMIDREINKSTLASMAGVSTATVTKLSKNENINMDIVAKICSALNCELSDIVDLVPVE